MNITFHPMQGPITHYLVECLYCRATTPVTDPIDAEALALAVTHGHATIPGCLNTSSCARSTFITAATDDGDLPHLTVSTLEARALLDHLGYSGDERCGEVDPSDFAGRVLTALALTPATVGATGSPVSDSALRTLDAVAHWARVRSRTVAWV